MGNQRPQVLHFWLNRRMRHGTGPIPSNCIIALSIHHCTWNRKVWIAHRKPTHVAFSCMHIGPRIHSNSIPPPVHFYSAGPPVEIFSWIRKMGICHEKRYLNLWVSRKWGYRSSTARFSYKLLLSLGAHKSYYNSNLVFMYNNYPVWCLHV